MTTHLKIDFVSDVSCPWCVIGLKALDVALARVDGEISAELRFQPFELNPKMGAGGQDITEHITEKYGITAAQADANREGIRARGEQLGFAFNMVNAAGGGRARIYNTFDAHRLLHWAGEVGKQRELKHAMLGAYHGEGRNPSDHGVLLGLVAEVGLDVSVAREVLESGRYTNEVRVAEAFWQRSGISAVPSVIINDQHLIQGGQPSEVFERALRQIAATKA